VKKFIRGLVILAAFSHLGCDLLPAPRDLLHDSLGTTIGFTFGRLMVSTLLSDGQKNTPLSRNGF
jgi:hypothetical protein